MRVKTYDYAVKITEKNGVVSIDKADSGGYLPANPKEVKEMLTTLIESKYPLSQYKLWLYDGDFAAFGIKTVTGKDGSPRPAGPITTAQLKKIIAAKDIMIGLTKRPFPQPKIVAYTANQSAPTKANKENRIGK